MHVAFADVSVWVTPSSATPWTAGNCTSEAPCEITSILYISEPTTVHFKAGIYANIIGLIQFDSVANPASNSKLILTGELSTSTAESLHVQVLSGTTGSPVLGDVAITAATFKSASFEFIRLNSLTMSSLALTDVLISVRAVPTISLDTVTWRVSTLVDSPLLATGPSPFPMTIDCSNTVDTASDVRIELKQVGLTCIRLGTSPASRNCTSAFHVLSLPLSAYIEATRAPPRIAISSGTETIGATSVIDFSTFLSVDLVSGSSDPVEWPQPIDYTFQRSFYFNYQSSNVLAATITWSSTGALLRPLFPLPQVYSSFSCTSCSVQATATGNSPPLLGMASGTNATSNAASISFTAAAINGISLVLSSPSIDLALSSASFTDCQISASSSKSIFLQRATFHTATLSGLTNPQSRAFFQIASPAYLLIEASRFIGAGSASTSVPNLLLVNASVSMSITNPSTSSQYYANTPMITVDRLAVGHSTLTGPSSSIGDAVLVGWTLVQQSVACYLGEGDISGYQRYSALGPSVDFAVGQVPCILAFGRDGSGSTSGIIPLDNLMTIQGEVVFDNVQLATLRNLQYKLMNASSLASGPSFLHSVGSLYAFTDTTATDSVSAINSSSPAVGILWMDPSTLPLSSTPAVNIPLYTYNNKTLHNPIPRVNSEISNGTFSITVYRRGATASTSRGMFFSTAEPLACPLPAPQPNTSFTCQNGIWISNSTGIVTGGPVLVTGSVVVTGNLNVSNVTFIGMNTSIQVHGCANLPTTVFITLTPADLELLRTNKEYLATLIASRCNASSGYQGEIHVSTDGSKIRPCERVTGTLKSNGNTLTGLFKFDSSKCSSKTWWIVLVSVIGGVILLIIILALVFTQVPAARRCIRPFTARDDKREAEANNTS